MRRLLAILSVLVLVAFAANSYIPLSSLWRSSADDPLEECIIKGNISLDGERIYHLPEGDWYEDTRIDLAQGERWFCSEEEAHGAGWRRSYE